MTNIKVSVILPFLNVASTLARAIESILEQSFKNFELILIDDGSKDQSTKIAMNYNDPRIRTIKLPPSGIVFLHDELKLIQTFSFKFCLFYFRTYKNLRNHL